MAAAAAAPAAPLDGRPSMEVIIEDDAPSELGLGAEADGVERPLTAASATSRPSSRMSGDRPKGIAELRQRRLTDSKLSRASTMMSSQSSKFSPASGNAAAVARRRIYQARITGNDVGAGDLAWEVASSTGVLIDYIQRCRGGDDLSDRGLYAEILRKQQVVDIACYRHAVAVVCREALQCTLMESITEESKRRGIFQKVDLGAWRKRADHVRKNKRETMCLRVEVTNMLMRRQMLRLAHNSIPEPMAERHGRLGEFWSAYQDRSRIVNAKPRDPGAAGSRPKYGMTWDIARGPQWRIVTPSPGSLSHGTLSQREQAYGRDSKVGMGYRSSSTPNLNGSQERQPLSNPGSPSSVRSAASGRSPKIRGGGKSKELLPPIQNRHRYLQECDKQGKIPTPMHVVTGHSKVLSAAGRNFVDQELNALAVMLKDMACVEEINLSENALLTDAGLSRFLQLVNQDAILDSLQKLDLSRCIKGGMSTLTSVIGLVKGGEQLQVLNLSQVPINSRNQLLLSQAIKGHPQMQSLNLAEVGMLPGESTQQCIKNILASSTLQTLDLSWNCFDGEVFKVLGEHVVYSNVLQKLRVVRCAASMDICSASDFIPPLSLFLEQLSHDRSLTYLDISMNSCDFRTALILEDALDTHKKLKELVLTNNPLGVLGIRSILRLLCRDHTALVDISVEGCQVGVPIESASLNAPIFSYTNPGGKYLLQLWRPYHRALLRMLYKTMEKFELQPAEAFEKITFRDKFIDLKYEHPSKNSKGLWEVPEQGDLSLVFCVERAIFKRFLSGRDRLNGSDNAEFLRRYYREVRFQPGFKKVIPLMSEYKELAGDRIGLQVFVSALSKDFNLTLAHLDHMGESIPEMVNEVICKLQPCAPEDMASKFLASKFFAKLEALLGTYRRLQQFLDFNGSNPTGHYKLELSNNAHYAVAERLLLLDRWEAAVDHMCERKDVSQRGNGSHLRNPLYQGHGLGEQYSSVAEWKLPEDGIFEVDFVSNQRPPKGSEVLSDELWEMILVVVNNSSCTNEDRIAALRAISHQFWITSSHMRAMIGYFKSEEDRANVFIIFYLRIVDLHNSKMFRVRFESAEEIKRLQERLGYASWFPFFQPENARFELDLSVNDQRLCAAMFIQLAIKEKFPHNLHDYGYRRADGTEDPMPLGVPKSWGNEAVIPKEGKFRARYMCAPEYRNFAHRKDIAATYGFLSGLEELQEEDVQWWTGLQEVPEDVLNLLEFFISRYDDVEQPFRDIDGVDGNGVITLKELVEGLEELGCKKFDTPKGGTETRTKAQRIDAIFRYLDPGAEGSVSRDEWNILGQLWKEFDQTIKEFVYFLMLTFGDDLLDAWQALDADDSGEMDEQEFLEAVEKIGYFGPAILVFALLDSSDDGNISFDEFEVLEKYKPQKYQGRA
mmetsp:Transcript_69167/g.174686  ORF Transcript_69167/g.174686 Transcript_69167/m.174686 type:complete len:1404 (-) Transcript_69167:67-4278(-)